MFYPAHLNLQNRKCLVVGGGTVAERKVVSLLLSGGDVTLICPEATGLLEDLARIDQITWYKRQFQAGDTEEMFLVCAATDLPVINTQVFKDAYEVNGIRLVNVVDVVSECTFAAASVVTSGNMVVGISTSGKSPAMSRRIREHLEAKFSATSLYTLGRQRGEALPIENREIAYPIYLLLTDRRCVVIGVPGQMSPEMTRRVELLRRCGALIVCLSPTKVAPRHLSDAFLVLIDESANQRINGSAFPRKAWERGKINRSCNAQHALRFPSQLVERLDKPEAGTFVTPCMVGDGDLVISISTQSGETADEGEVKQVHKELANQFENRGYGAFIDFLGSLRPLALRKIPTQKARQKFFDTLIDLPPRSDSDLSASEEQRCCLGFTGSNCSTDCVFNRIRHGQVERAYQFANERMGEFAN